MGSAGKGLHKTPQAKGLPSMQASLNFGLLSLGSIIEFLSIRKVFVLAFPFRPF